MRLRLLSGMIAVLALAGVNAGTCLAQDKPAEPPPAIVTTQQENTVESAIAAGVTGAIEVLRSAGMEIREADAVRAAARAVITAADPGARFLGIEEARALEASGAAGVVQTGSVAAIEFWSNRICLVKMSGLFPDAVAAVKAVRDACNNVTTGIILDLRGAGGHDMAAADAVASLFAKPGSALYRVEDLKGNIVESHAAKGTAPVNLPVAILVDSRTTGSAEVLAGCLRGFPGVALVGEATRGDLALRKVAWVDAQSPVLLAFRRVVCERGGDYRGGIQPDIAVPASESVNRPVAKTDAGARDEEAEETESAGPVSPRAGAAYDLVVEHAGTDVALARAADILISLKALGGYDFKR